MKSKHKSIVAGQPFTITLNDSFFQRGEFIYRGKIELHPPYPGGLAPTIDEARALLAQWMWDNKQ